MTEQERFDKWWADIGESNARSITNYLWTEAERLALVKMLAAQAWTKAIGYDLLKRPRTPHIPQPKG